MSREFLMELCRPHKYHRVMLMLVALVSLMECLTENKIYFFTIISHGLYEAAREKSCSFFSIFAVDFTANTIEIQPTVSCSRF